MQWLGSESIGAEGGVKTTAARSTAPLLAGKHPAGILTGEAHMSGAGVIGVLLSLGLGFPIGADAHTNADDAGAVARPPPSGEPSENEATTASFSVERIDRSSRSLIVRSPDGSRMTVKVAPAVAEFDKLQKGDQVELDYYASSVLSFGAGAAPADRARETATRASAPPLGAVGSGGAPLITTSARVTTVDKDKGRLQITTSDGLPQTLLVRDPDARRELRSLGPGDTVVVTYAEPLAVGLRTGAHS
jgi:hypothetical protein